MPTLMDKNEIYNSQLAIMFFLVCFFSKLSSLPALLSESVGSSTLYVVIFYCVFELILFSFVYMFVTNGGMNYLKNSGNKLYKILLALWIVVIIVKQTYFYAYVVDYVAIELFETVSKALIVFTVVFPIAYLAMKGIRTIARVTEIVFVFAILLILFDLIFLETNVDLANNTPVFSMDFLPLSAESFQYGIWSGESLPFLFIKIKNKKRIPYLGVSSVATMSLIPLIAMLAVGIYGASLFLVGNTIVSLTPFNALTNSLGRLEWTALLAYLSLVVTALSTHFWATSQLFESFGCNRKVSLVLIALAISLFLLFTPNIRSFMRSAKGLIGIVTFVMHFFIPLLLLLTLLYDKRKKAKQQKILADTAEEG